MREVRLKIDRELAGQRLDRALTAMLPDQSRSRLKALILDGRVKTAERAAIADDPARKAVAGEEYIVSIPDPAPAVPEGQAIPLTVVYEDQDIIVIDKPAGMVVHPAPGNQDRTLVNALIAHCGQSLSGIGGVRRPGIVHRIDKDTSGLLIAAKNDKAHRALAECFQKHDIERAYLCLVWGIPAPIQGEIAGNIGRHPVHRKQMAVRPSGGKPATTHYRVLRRFGDTLSLVECRLLTGRTHQIRVHMASIGHPVVGDSVYGRSRRRGYIAGDRRVRAASQFPRQALHAALLGIKHPITGKDLLWESALPSDIADLLSEINSLSD